MKLAFAAVAFFSGAVCGISGAVLDNLHDYARTWLLVISGMCAVVGYGLLLSHKTRP